MNKTKTKWNRGSGQAAGGSAAKLAELDREILESVIGWTADRLKSPMEALLFKAMVARLDAFPWREWCVSTEADGPPPRKALTDYVSTLPPYKDEESWSAYPTPIPYTCACALLLNYPVGRYVPDFLILAEQDGRIFKCVVEVDGHDFHEKTKEQAAHDKKRDRWFQTNGYSVLRFTGSEVYADPKGCAGQVHDHVMGLMQEEYYRRRAS